MVARRRHHRPGERQPGLGKLPLSEGSESTGAPVAVPAAGLPKAPARCIDRYEDLDEDTFLSLLEGVRPRHLRGRAFTLGGGAALLTYQSARLLGLIALPPAFFLVDAMLLGVYGLLLFGQATLLRRVVAQEAEALGIRASFAERIATDLPVLLATLPKHERPGLLAPWDEKKRALLKAFRHKQGAARAPGRSG
jgi:hypothetical protein